MVGQALRKGHTIVKRAAPMSLWWLGVALAAVTLWLAPITPCIADEVDTAVEAFAVGGAAVGVSIGPTEKELVKSAVRCVVVARRPVGTCARDELIRRLPQDAQPLAGCLIGGRPLPQCAQQVIIA